MKPFTLCRPFRFACAFILFVVSPSLHGQVYTDLFDFNSTTSGSNPLNPGLIAQGQDGNLYSTLQSGGPKFGLGTVYVYQPGGTVNLLYNFDGTDGNGPMSGLSLGFDGNFYGATYLPHGSEQGEVFKITPSGTLTVLYPFANGTDGGFPQAPPVQAPDGNLYGVTNGTIPTAYQISPSGSFKVLANLPSKTNAPLILGTDSNLYGTTVNGGTFNRGTAFQLTTKGKLKIIHNFNDPTGGLPVGPLMQASDGKLYGTTPWGGTSSGGVIYVMTTSGGGYKVLHNLSTTNVAEGSGSASGLVQGSDSFLYGAMPNGGANGLGTFFKINTTGTTYTVLHDFDKATGSTPMSTPLLHTSGLIYGMTENSSKQGALYSIDVGLQPFASLFVIWSGKVGTSVGIMGQGFNRATGVKFGTGLGSFTVVSDTYMTATAAAGATTGPATVLEPGGNLVTPQMFKVIPTISSFSPKSGPVGTLVTINGMSLKQTSSVTIGKAKAAFTVVSDTQVTATVGAGAVTGKVTLKTKGGTATGPGNFTVN